MANKLPIDEWFDDNVNLFYDVTIFAIGKSLAPCNSDLCTNRERKKKQIVFF